MGTGVCDNRLPSRSITRGMAGPQGTRRGVRGRDVSPAEGGAPGKGHAYMGEVLDRRRLFDAPETIWISGLLPTCLRCLLGLTSRWLLLGSTIRKPGAWEAGPLGRGMPCSEADPGAAVKGLVDGLVDLSGQWSLSKGGTPQRAGGLTQAAGLRKGTD